MNTEATPIKEARTIILLESDEAVIEQVQSLVLAHDLALETALSPENALRLLSRGQGMAFFFDANLLHQTPLDFLVRVRQDHPDLPVIALLDDHFKDEALDLLKAGLDSCLDLPLQPEALAYSLGRIISNNTDTYNPFAVKYEERIIVMPNDFSLVTQVAKNLVDTTLPPHEKHRYHIILGLTEIINNAVEHGNLGITFEEKSNALKASRFHPLAIERAHREPYKDRVVTVRARVFPALRRIEYHVADQGSGFDWRSLPDPSDKKNLLNRNGRGILMARHAFEEIVYNDVGNEVTLVVLLDHPFKAGRG